MRNKRKNKVILKVPHTDIENNKSIDKLINNDTYKNTYNYSNLLPLVKYIELLDISRAAFERNFLDDNSNVGRRGIRYFELSTEFTSRHKIYIDINDFKDYFIEYFEFALYWIEESDGNKVLKKYKKDQINEDNQKEIFKLFFEDQWKSNRELQNMMDKSRSMISRLVNVIDSISFYFPNSSRQNRRFILRHDLEYYKDVIKYYKSYENEISHVE